MSLHAIQGVLISTDDEVRRALEDPEVRRKLDLVLSFSVPMAGFSAGHLDDLRERGADLILLDVESDPELGCRLAEKIADAGAGRRIVGIGPMQSPEFLLRAMQSGIAEYLTKPLQKVDLLAAIERARRSLAVQPVGTLRSTASSIIGSGPVLYTCTATSNVWPRTTLPSFASTRTTSPCARRSAFSNSAALRSRRQPSSAFGAAERVLAATVWPSCRTRARPRAIAGSVLCGARMSNASRASCAAASIAARSPASDGTRLASAPANETSRRIDVSMPSMMSVSGARIAGSASYNE